MCATRSQNVYDTNMTTIQKVLKSSAVRRLPVFVKQESDVEHGTFFLLD